MPRDIGWHCSTIAYEEVIAAHRVTEITNSRVDRVNALEIGDLCECVRRLPPAPELGGCSPTGLAQTLGGSEEIGGQIAQSVAEQLAWVHPAISRDS